ncbi:MAG: hypothetical protein H6662_00265 [Ardenticatenaceae bacterium]|nr:hypothetical protein [Ardenticatenaceae bacterium]MCB8989836.1 hypothetical protein [Ardenticatenaceae bacterium]
MQRTILPLLVLFLLLGGVSLARADEMALTQTVQASQTAVYQLEIHNETAVVHDYTLALSGLPAGLTTTFTQGGPLVSQITVPANEYGLATMRVDVPVETAVGHYAAQFTTTRDDGEPLTLPVTLNVENTYAVKIVSQNLNVTAFSGKEFVLDVTAVNSGAAAVTNLALTVDAPAKWIVQTTPATIPTLAAGAETAFHVIVTVPSSQVAADQKITLALASDQTASPDSPLTVRVQNSPTFLYVALTVMGLAIVGAVIYFRRKGRR